MKFKSWKFNGVCTDINECLDECKQKNTECINTIGSFKCVAKPGYTFGFGTTVRGTTHRRQCNRIYRFFAFSYKYAVTY